MTTTYYIETNRCEHCGRCDKISIGISAVGWKFLFYTDEHHRNAAAWLVEIMQGGKIYDRYGNTISPDAFAKLISSKRRDKSTIPSPIPLADEDYDYEVRPVE
jgi:hypothetical protein